MFPYEAVFSSIICFISLTSIETKTKLLNIWLICGKCHQLLIIRDSESEHFLQSLWQLNVPWRVASENKGKKRSWRVQLIREDFLQEFILELTFDGSKKSHLMWNTGDHSRQGSTKMERERSWSFSKVNGPVELGEVKVRQSCCKGSWNWGFFHPWLSFIMIEIPGHQETATEQGFPGFMSNVSHSLSEVGILHPRVAHSATLLENRVLPSTWRKASADDGVTVSNGVVFWPFFYGFL